MHQINQQGEENIRTRQKALEQLAQSVDSDCSKDKSFHENPHLDHLFRACFPGSNYFSVGPICPPGRVPLNDCILAIAWETSNWPPSLPIFSDMEVLESLSRLLPRAAAYQADYREVFYSIRATHEYQILISAIRIS